MEISLCLQNIILNFWGKYKLISIKNNVTDWVVQIGDWIPYEFSGPIIALALNLTDNQVFCKKY